MSIWGGFKQKIYNILVGIGVMGVGAGLIGLAPENGFLLAMVAFFISSLSNTVLNGSSLALAQAIIQQDMQGRVFALFSSLGGAFAPLGLLVAAPIIELTNIQFWFILSGAVCIFLTIISFWMPALLNLEKSNPPQIQIKTSEKNYALPGGED
jgi:DHA3 family macrolide efflux protein-like MFS transporter